jgi:hypothetical protein
MVDHEPRGSADGPSGIGSRPHLPDVTAVPVPWVAVIGGIALLVLLVVLATVAESRSVLLG